MKIPSLVIMDTINIDHENIKILNIPKSKKISLFVWFIRLCSPSIVHIGAFLMSAGPYKYILLKTWGLTYLPAGEMRSCGRNVSADSVCAHQMRPCM